MYMDTVSTLIVLIGSFASSVQYTGCKAYNVIFYVLSKFYYGMIKLKMVLVISFILFVMSIVVKRTTVGLKGCILRVDGCNNVYSFKVSFSKLCIPCIFFWAPLHVLCGLSHHQALVLRLMGYPV
jgi:hypothetical protein